QKDAPRLWQRRCAHPVCDLCRGNGLLQTIFAPGGPSELDLCGCEFHCTLTIVGWYFSLLPVCAYFPFGPPLWGVLRALEICAPTPSDCPESGSRTTIYRFFYLRDSGKC